MQRCTDCQLSFIFQISNQGKYLLILLILSEFFIRTRRGSGSSVISTSSLIPTSNIKEIGSKLGRSLLNLASMITGSDSLDAQIQTTLPSTSKAFDMKPLPPTPGSRPRDTPIIPRRPPRRKMSFDRSRHKSLTGSSFDINIILFICSQLYRDRIKFSS